ncbi:unnamed protein product [Malassezia sympodialis ATCC 42132]|uniref:uncharacterized protein n=1 Tax=Malassezia sympodialis (strain ATCC 42132) TaxID=1230383 RepID=UPI0002C1FAA5|nr:uncharacterized protein MSY001_2327 [Malassezia sympodialis ATCC 42132]CCU99621.1 unnamed protein product [Malassezia sympodialis ATCC 42132]|eukprot:XP_018740860.1 uncharacterized protein MSY001_2327 [Malassezia sympodialis ATCC 42132]
MQRIEPNLGLRPGMTWDDVRADLQRTAKAFTYGKEAWERYWARRTTDGELVWGPDPDLTCLGQAQARDVHKAWRTALRQPDAQGRAPERVPDPAMIPPLPQVLCSSPLRRSLHTLFLTWRGLLPQRPPQPVHVREHLREVIGKNTCDQRSTKSEILECPNRETDDAMRTRIHHALEDIWQHEAKEATGTHITTAYPSIQPYVSWGCHAPDL